MFLRTSQTQEFRGNMHLCNIVFLDLCPCHFLSCLCFGIAGGIDSNRVLGGTENPAVPIILIISLLTSPLHSCITSSHDLFEP